VYRPDEVFAIRSDRKRIDVVAVVDDIANAAPTISVEVGEFGPREILSYHCLSNP
jgi:hypothetical protein